MREDLIFFVRQAGASATTVLMMVAVLALLEVEFGFFLAVSAGIFFAYFGVVFFSMGFLVLTAWMLGRDLEDLYQETHHGP